MKKGIEYIHVKISVGLDLAFLKMMERRHVWQLFASDALNYTHIQIFSRVSELCHILHIQAKVHFIQT